jgi:hypothetical protein
MALCNLFQGSVYQIPSLVDVPNGNVLTTTGTGGVVWAPSHAFTPATYIFVGEITLNGGTPVACQIAVSTVNSITSVSILPEVGQNTLPIITAGNGVSGQYLIISIPTVGTNTQFFDGSGAGQFMGTFSLCHIQEPAANSTAILMDAICTYSAPSFTILCLNASSAFVNENTYTFGSESVTTNKYSASIGRFLITAAVEAVEVAPIQPTAQATPTPVEPVVDELAEALEEEMPQDLTNSVLLEAIKMVSMNRKTKK